MPEHDPENDANHSYPGPAGLQQKPWMKLVSTVVVLGIPWIWRKVRHKKGDKKCGSGSAR